MESRDTGSSITLNIRILAKQDHLLSLFRDRLDLEILPCIFVATLDSSGWYLPPDSGKKSSDEVK